METAHSSSHLTSRKQQSFNMTLHKGHLMPILPSTVRPDYIGILLINFPEQILKESSSIYTPTPKEAILMWDNVRQGSLTFLSPWAHLVSVMGTVTKWLPKMAATRGDCYVLPQSHNKDCCAIGESAAIAVSFKTCTANKSPVANWLGLAKAPSLALKKWWVPEKLLEGTMACMATMLGISGTVAKSLSYLDQEVHTKRCYKEE